MFRSVKLLLKNHQLQEENKILYEEKKQNEEYLEELEQLAESLLIQVNNLESIDRCGNSEEFKRKNRNKICNQLRKLGINTIKNLRGN